VTAFFLAVHALIRRGDHFLLLHRSPTNDYMPDKWDIPGGTVEAGETAEAALAREVFEETALRVQAKNILYVFTNCDQVPVRQTFQLVYLADYVDGPVRINPNEHDEYRWLKKSDIRGLNTIPFLDFLTHSPEFDDLGD
jgi:mutator protein MutT